MLHATTLGSVGPALQPAPQASQPHDPAQTFAAILGQAQGQNGPPAAPDASATPAAGSDPSALAGLHGEALWRALGQQFDPSSMSQEDLDHVVDQLYDAGEISFDDAADLHSTGYWGGLEGMASYGWLGPAWHRFYLHKADGDVNWIAVFQQFINSQLELGSEGAAKQLHDGPLAVLEHLDAAGKAA